MGPFVPLVSLCNQSMPRNVKSKVTWENSKKEGHIIGFGLYSCAYTKSPETSLIIMDSAGHLHNVPMNSVDT